MRKLLPASIALLLLMNCQRHRGASNDPSNTQTQTIAPAVAQPAPTGTDQMTQTVDVEGGRSEAEGGTSSSPKKPTPPAKSTPKKKH